MLRTQLSATPAVFTESLPHTVVCAVDCTRIVDPIVVSKTEIPQPLSSQRNAATFAQGHDVFRASDLGMMAQIRVTPATSNRVTALRPSCLQLIAVPLRMAQLRSASDKSRRFRDICVAAALPREADMRSKDQSFVCS